MMKTIVKSHVRKGNIVRKHSRVIKKSADIYYNPREKELLLKELTKDKQMQEFKSDPIVNETSYDDTEALARRLRLGRRACLNKVKKSAANWHQFEFQEASPVYQEELNRIRTEDLNSYARSPNVGGYIEYGSNNPRGELAISDRRKRYSEFKNQNIKKSALFGGDRTKPYTDNVGLVHIPTPDAKTAGNVADKKGGVPRETKDGWEVILP